jgi:hypothetical protein
MPLASFFNSFFITFLIYSAAFAHAKETVATIDSLEGRAEIQKAGQQRWLAVAAGAKLHSSDVVRALNKSFIRISWPDGNNSFVHANSQIILNFFESNDPDVISTHITVLYGALFFVIKEILPKAIIKTYDTKVYTPTAVVSVRGTGFGVDVEGKSGATTVKVLNGTLLVRNILMDASTFLSAGFKSTVEMKTDPVVPKTLLDKDIADLKAWVPPPVIEKELSTQIVRAQREHRILTDDFKDKLAIVPFVNKSKYKGQWDVGRSFAHQLADQIEQSNKNVAVSDDDTSVTDPLKLGQALNARFVIVGEVTEFDIVQRAEISAAADEYKEFYIAKTTLRVQLISVADKKMLFDNTFTGETRGKNQKENSWQSIGKLGLVFKDSPFSRSILGASSQQVFDQAAESIIRLVNAQ